MSSLDLGDVLYVLQHVRIDPGAELIARLPFLAHEVVSSWPR
jgi:hypothetical protein